MVRYYDTSETTYFDYLDEAIDKSTSTHVPLDAMPHGATGDWLYLGSVEPVLGYYFAIDSSNKNATTATLDVEYSSTTEVANHYPPTAIGFTDVTGDDDGTDSTGTETGNTLEQSGVYVWTLPTAWVRSSLTGVTSQLLYWIRFRPSATLSATIDLDHIIPVYQNTNYAYFEAGTEYQFSLNQDKVGAFTLLGTASSTLDISWVRH